MNELDNELVSVIISNRNGKNYLPYCLKSLAIQTHKEIEVVLVDNVSTDESLKIARAYNNIKIIELNEDKGFSGGTNIGVQYSKGRYALLLNNDTRFGPELIEKMYEHITKHGCAAVFPINISVTSLDDNTGIEVNGYTLNLLGYNISMNNNFVFYPRCACVLIDKKIVGLPFDNDYFLYSEDAYLGWRLRLEGELFCQIDNAQVFHLNKPASKASYNFFVYHDYKNKLMNLLLFFDTINLIKIAPLILVNQIISLIFLPKKPYLKSIYWILTNIYKIKYKRGILQKARKVDDDLVIKMMSCNLDPNNRLPIFNRIIGLYCRTVGLKTKEIL